MRYLSLVDVDDVLAILDDARVNLKGGVRGVSFERVQRLLILKDKFLLFRLKTWGIPVGEGYVKSVWNRKDKKKNKRTGNKNIKVLV